MLKVLHISSSFTDSRLYSQLVRHIDLLSVSQAVLTSQTTSFYNKFSSNSFPSSVVPESVSSNFYSYPVFRPFDTFFFGRRISRAYKALSLICTRFQPDIIHAHFLYTDGLPAYLVHRKLGIPYVVTVRNTDLNFHMPWRPFMRKLIYRVIQSASHLTFLSEDYMKRFMANIPNELVSEISSKSFVIPNGIDADWISPSKDSTLYPKSSFSSINKCFRLLYVGNFSSNKNLYRLIKAVNFLSQYVTITLTLVGGSQSDLDIRLDSRFDSNFFNNTFFHDHISDRLQLKRLYQDHDIFVMPSLTETFGLVYLEALSQGLPVVCSKGEGISGFFPSSEYCVFVDPRNVSDIIRGIMHIILNYRSIKSTSAPSLLPFSWSNVAANYVQLYRSGT